MLSKRFVAGIIPVLVLSTPVEIEVHRKYDKLMSHADFLKADHEHVKIHARNLEKRGIQMSLHDAQPFQVTSTSATTETHTLPVYARTGPSTSTKYASLLVNSTAPIIGLREQIFVVPVSVGGQSLHAILDTG